MFLNLLNTEINLKGKKNYVKINLYVTEKHTYEVWNSNQLYIAAKY